MTLGLVANGKREIRSGRDYDGYFDMTAVKGGEVFLINGTAFDTLRNMKKIVRSTLPQTKRIAQKLKGNSREATCRKIWEFLYNHVQYKTDVATREQLRTPIRTWRDRITGVDCDCYAIFISSVLTNLDIPHTFRMAAYKNDKSGAPAYQHVYVVVPKNGDNFTSYYTIDPVVSRFDYETPFIKKYDHGMDKANSLNGFGGLTGCTPKRPLRRYAFTEDLRYQGLVPTEEFLKEHNLAFESIINPVTEGGAYSVTTRSGPVIVPTVMTKQQAQQLLNLINGGIVPPGANNSSTPTTTTPATTQPEGEKKKFPWWWVALGAGALILLTGEDQDEVKTGLNGVRGTHKPKAKAKLTTIHI